MQGRETLVHLNAVILHLNKHKNVLIFRKVVFSFSNNRPWRLLIKGQHLKNGVA